MNTDKPERSETPERILDHTATHEHGITASTRLEIELERSEYMGDAAETVPVYSGAQTEVRPNGSERVLVTKELNGCVVVVVACETQDGTRLGQLTHFPPFLPERQQRKITELMTSDMQFAPTKRALIFFRNARAIDVGAMREFLEQALGGDVLITVHPYDSDTQDPHSGTLVVHFPPKGEGAVTCVTWQDDNEITLIQDTSIPLHHEP